MDATLAEQVRKRARDRCEYCLLPQSAHVRTFPIDHIIAQQHNGPTSLENLALSCVRCNSHKGPNIAGMDPATGQMVRLFHPRQDDWTEHFEFSGPYLVGRTPIGRATIGVLTINDPDYVLLRESLIEEGLFTPDS